MARKKPNAKSFARSGCSGGWFDKILIASPVINPRIAAGQWGDFY
jgi:hypothetical protein